MKPHRKLDNMFQLAIIGPFLRAREGVVQQCIECRAANPRSDHECMGFGAGCLVAPRAPETKKDRRK